jgi:hypothetical protein
MSTNIPASSNTGQTVPVHEEECSVSKDVTDDKGVTALTTAPATEGEASAIDEFCSGENVMQDAQVGSRLTIMSTDETGGSERHQKEQPFK